MPSLTQLKGFMWPKFIWSARIFHCVFSKVVSAVRVYGVVALTLCHKLEKFFLHSTQLFCHYVLLVGVSSCWSKFFRFLWMSAMAVHVKRGLHQLSMVNACVCTVQGIIGLHQCSLHLPPAIQHQAMFHSLQGMIHHLCLSELLPCFHLL